MYLENSTSVLVSVFLQGAKSSAVDSTDDEMSALDL